MFKKNAECHEIDQFCQAYKKTYQEYRPETAKYKHGGLSACKNNKHTRRMINQAILNRTYKKNTKFVAFQKVSCTIVGRQKSQRFRLSSLAIEVSICEDFFFLTPRVKACVSR